MTEPRDEITVNHSPEADPPTLDVAPPDNLHELATLAPGAVPSPSSVEAPVDAPSTASLSMGEPTVSTVAVDLARAGQAFGDYELLGEIARGGMGVVYRAREKQSGRIVALKMMLSKGAADSVDLQRFILEARATAELNHPGIVTIHAWGENEGRFFYTMDYVPGFALHRILSRRRPLAIPRAVRYLRELAVAVGAAHAQGIVHRDLKPSNVILDTDDHPRVLDFGLAKRRPAPGGPAPAADIVDVLPADAPLPPPSSPPTSPRATPPPTQKGTILGTPAYMAPEQARGDQEQVGPAADVHALGAIFYEMLTGQPPFQAPSLMDTLLEVMERAPTPPRQLNPQVPVSLEAICLRCLQKDPAERYPDAAALAADLERQWLRATQARRFARLTLIALAIIIGWQLLPRWGLHLAALEPFELRVEDFLAQSATPWLQEPARVLMNLFSGFVGAVAPMLVQGAALAWLGAWLWYTDRRWLAPVCFAIIGVAAVIGGLTDAWLLTPWHLAAAAVAVTTLVLCRRLAERQHQEETGEAVAESYLQKLFSPALTSRSQAGESGRSPTLTALQDVELGKPLLDNAECVIRRGRQISLDRPVLVWLEPSTSAAGTLAGIVVRHPSVLCLHAAGTCPQGRFLVTEAVAAIPLAELLEQRQLEPLDAVLLLARIARAVQAFHHQGACHGRLSPDWILVEGDLQPLLCPCGRLHPSSEDRAADVRALGKLLQGWLPPRERRWERQPLATIYKIADAAAAGEYARAGELGRDLEYAARIVTIRWRERVGNRAVLALFSLALVAFALAKTVTPSETMPNLADAALEGFLFFQALAATLLGFIHGRGLAHFFRLRLHRKVRSRFLQYGVLPGVIRLSILAGLPAGAVGLSIWGLGQGAAFRAGLACGLVTISFWLAGFALAVGVTFAELVVGSLRSRSPEELLESIGLFTAASGEGEEDVASPPSLDPQSVGQDPQTVLRA